MKLIVRIGCGVFCGLALTARAQDFVSKTVATPSPSPQPAASVEPTPLPAGDLIPGALPNPTGPNATPPPAGPVLPDLSQLNQIFEQSGAGKQSADYRAHVEWRQLKTRTMYDSDVMAAKAWALSAPTDLEKRKRLHAYYELFYRRMMAHASSQEVADYLKAARDAHYTSLAQPKTRPTPESEATPAPSPSPSPSPLATPIFPLPVPEPTLTPLELPH